MRTLCIVNCILIKEMELFVSFLDSLVIILILYAFTIGYYYHSLIFIIQVIVNIQLLLSKSYYIIIGLLLSFSYCYYSVIVIIQLLVSISYCYHSVIVIIQLLLSLSYWYQSVIVIMQLLLLFSYWYQSVIVIIQLLLSFSYCYH